MIYFCCDRRRRSEVENTALNGIDYLEVLDGEAPAGSPRQQTLLVRCLKALPEFDGGNVRIEGGERIRPVKVVWAVRADLAASSPATAVEQTYFTNLDETENVLVVRTDSSGDYSTYRLALQASALEADPPADFDPRLAAIEFSFKVECPSDFDCRPERVCPPAPLPEPEIDYLAKDYASFRRLMLDRMATLAPQWQERNAADLGIALVELLAYVGDHLSYEQDAVATEAYLGTARRRISVRRHARLVDYFMSDGKNARTWVQVEVTADVKKTLTTGPAMPKGTKLLTRIAGQEPGALADDPRIYGQAEVVFETMETVDDLFQDHNRMPFHTWSDRECCLPRGATAATLAGHYPNLRPGEVLIFEEVLGPHTGQPGDADPERRHPVRLTAVQANDGGNPLKDPVTNEDITEIGWAEADALPFAFCISSITDARHGGVYVDEVSVARGNVVLADHGLTIADEPLGTVPEPTVFRPPERGGDRCRRRDPEAVAPRFRPRLDHGPVTQAGPYDAAAPARDALAVPQQRDVLPAVTLESDLHGDTETWSPVRDLLASDDDRTEFVVEVESDGTAYLRFGDDRHGKRPNAGTEFQATYRVGNGTAGNVGADALVHVVTSQSDVGRVRNLLPGRGGAEPESIEDVRQRAPEAFKTQERAVTPADYAAVTERHPGLQKAAATFRWTGSWHTVFLTVDRLGGLDVDDPFERDVRRHVERFRMAGHDLEVDGPRWVPLEIEIQVCVEPDHFRSDVAADLLEVLSNRTLADGRRGVFHPDHFTFGQSVYLSRLYEAAQKVPGVASVHVKVFQRQGQPDTEPLEQGKLELNRLEIARLDNDRNYPERGVLRLDLAGGK